MAATVTCGVAAAVERVARPELVVLASMAEVLGCAALLEAVRLPAARAALRDRLVAWLAADPAARPASPFDRLEWQKVFTPKVCDRAYRLALELRR